MMNKHNTLTPDQEATFRRLATQARAIEDSLSDLSLATLQADIPDDVKLGIQDWISRADTFQGLSYFLTPQSEWLGGSDDNAKWAVRPPHIARG